MQAKVKPNPLLNGNSGVVDCTTRSLLLQIPAKKVSIDPQHTYPVAAHWRLLFCGCLRPWAVVHLLESLFVIATITHALWARESILSHTTVSNPCLDFAAELCARPESIG